jgi:phosphopentomutase
MKQILREMQPEDFGDAKANFALENMLENNGFHIPNNKKLRLENIYRDDTVTDFDKDFQKPRAIKPETRKKFI